MQTIILKYQWNLYHDFHGIDILYLYISISKAFHNQNFLFHYQTFEPGEVSCMGPEVLPYSVVVLSLLSTRTLAHRWFSSAICIAIIWTFYKPYLLSI